VDAAKKPGGAPVPPVVAANKAAAGNKAAAANKAPAGNANTAANNPPPPKPQPAPQSPPPSTKPQPAPQPPPGPPDHGVLHYTGPPVPVNGTVEFGDLPAEKLKFNFDQSLWALKIEKQPNGLKKLILHSKAQGVQTTCDGTWEIAK